MGFRLREMLLQLQFLADRREASGDPISPLNVKRLLLILLIVTLGFTRSYLEPSSDFAQDYLSASAVLDGNNPNTASRDLARQYGVPEGAITSLHNAHPPAATLLALPYVRFPWGTAHLLWEMFLCVTVGVFLLFLPIPPATLIFLAPAWIFGLGVGNIDGIVICLCLLSASSPSRVISGGGLGLAAAIKVYPCFFILALLVTGKIQAFTVALVTGAVVTLAATAFVGLNGFLGWLSYIPLNGDIFANNNFNLSLTKITTGALGIHNFYPLILGCGMLLLQMKKKNFEPLLPGLLLISPLAWLQQLPLAGPFLSLKEQVFSFICSVVILSGSYVVASTASIFLTMLILLVYLRILRQQKSG